MSKTISVIRPKTISEKEASVRILTYKCGCETMKCLAKADCAVGHNCDVCRSKVFKKHCHTHKGRPTGYPSIMFL